MGDRPQFITQEYAASVLEPMLSELFALDYSRAASLPEAEERMVNLTREHACVWVYRECRPQGVVRVVVQLAAIHGKTLGIFHAGQSFAEGVEFNLGKSPRRLRADELYDYT